ncbi:MAG: hypothetical protein H6621_04295 [Halobacteriovoraceae bacterium]|nr:hypothetical protein [Halobacteriovoraceae bacterium]
MKNIKKAKHKKDLGSDVLFQKLGNRWYIFTEKDGELVYSVMPDGMDPRKTKLELYEVIEEHMDNIRKKPADSELY